MSDFVPKYAYTLLELNSVFKQVKKELEETAKKLQVMQNISDSSKPNS
jgi:predicted transcriptional regulator